MYFHIYKFLGVKKTNTQSRKRGVHTNPTINEETVPQKKQKINSQPQSQTPKPVIKKKVITKLAQIRAYSAPTFTVKGIFTYIEPIQKIPVKFSETDYFYGVLIDSDSTERKVNFWGKHAIHFFSTLKLNVIYEIYGLKPRKQSDVRSQSYGSIQLSCTQHTVINEISKKESEDDEDEDDDLNFSAQSWKVIDNIQVIKDVKEHAYVDVIGVVTDIEQPTTVSTRRNAKTPIRKFTLADEGATIQVTLWFDKASIPLKENQIIGLKRARVLNYGGKSLSANGLITNPKHSRVDALQIWKTEQTGSLTKVINLTEGAYDYDVAEVLTIPEAKQLKERFRHSQKMPLKKIYKIKAAVKEIDPNMFYLKNDSIPDWRLKITMVDVIGNCFPAVAFNEAAVKIMRGYSAEEAGRFIATNLEFLEHVIQKVLDVKMELIFCVRIKVNSWDPKMHTLDFIIDDLA